MPFQFRSLLIATLLAPSSFAEPAVNATALPSSPGAEPAAAPSAAPINAAASQEPTAASASQEPTTPSAEPGTPAAESSPTPSTPSPVVSPAKAPSAPSTKADTASTTATPAAAAATPVAPAATAWNARNTRLIVGAERLVGYSSLMRTRTAADGSESSRTSESSLNLLAAGGPSASGVLNPFVLPRLAFDAVLLGHLTLGGTVAYLNSSGTVEVDRGENAEDPAEQEDLEEKFTLLANPRVGYLFHSSPITAFWLRAGVTLGWVAIRDEERDRSAGERFVNLSVSPALVITPFPHTAFILGFDADISLSGSSEPFGESERDDIETSAIGLNAGFSLMF